MKHAKVTLFLVALLLTPLFLAGIGMPSVSTEKNVLEPTTERTMTKAYDTHSAIRIENDTDFHDQAIAESWPGDGSVDFPFLIEGWNISVNDVTPIWIRDTSYHFIIQDCYLTVGTGWNSASGIYLHNVTNAAVLECVIHHVDTGINTNSAHGLVVEGCTIYDCDNGIYFMGNDYVASQNTVFDCIRGIVLEEVLDGVVHDNELYMNDQYGLFMEPTSHCNVTENTIYSNGDCGIYLNSCPNVRIEGNIIFDNSHVFEACGINMQATDDALILNNHIENNTWTGIFAMFCDRPYIAGNTIANNSNHGIIGSYNENVTIHENDIYHNGWWWVEDYSSLPIIGGITVAGNQNWEITANSIWNNTGAGVAVIDAAFITISDNDLYNNTVAGIYSDTLYDVTTNCTAIGNDIWGNGWLQAGPLDVSGIVIYSGEFWLVQDNRIFENEWNGIFAYGSNHAFIGNEVFDNVDDGIWIVEASYNTVVDNIIYNNTIGLFLVAIEAEVVENLIYHNEYGVVVDHIGNNTIFGNDICWNDINAFDVYDEVVDADNFWYDEATEVGNWYSDFDGIGTFYWIYNETGIVNVDAHPHQSLSLEAADPVEYEISSSGIMEWVAQARNPSHWVLYIDETPVEDGEWTGGNIIVDFAGLSAGVHDVMLEVFHITGHSVNATSTANVTDSTPPEWIVGPSDQEIDEGDALNTQFSAEDPSGIGAWGINDTVNFHIGETGLLTNNTVLAIGDYGLRVTVEDTFGNERDYEIRIRVLYVPPATTTTPTLSTTTATTTTTTIPTTTGTTTTNTTSPPPFDPTMIIIIVGAGGAVIIIIVIVIIGKKR